MKTTKTTTTAYEVENPVNGNSDLIIGAYTGHFFVKTSDGIFRYSANEMNEVYHINMVSLMNIEQVLNR